MSEDKPETYFTEGKAKLGPNGEIIPIHDLFEWARWFENSGDERRICATRSEDSPFQLCSSGWITVATLLVSHRSGLRPWCLEKARAAISGMTRNTLKSATRRSSKHEPVTLKFARKLELEKSENESLATSGVEFRALALFLARIHGRHRRLVNPDNRDRDRPMVQTQQRLRRAGGRQK